MPDWKGEVRARLASLNLSPTREAEIVDELSQHLDDRYRESIAGGASPEAAKRLAFTGFQDGDVLAEQNASLRQAHAPPRSRLQRPPDMRSAISGRISDTRHGYSASSRPLPRPPS